MFTPWGATQGVEELAKGIWVVHTASHGGIKLSADRQRQMPAGMRQTWYEEDCEMPHVIKNFWDEVAPVMLQLGWKLDKQRIEKRCIDWPWCSLTPQPANAEVW